MADLFSDGFESGGTGSWSTVFTQSGGSVSVLTSAGGSGDPRTGTYFMRSRLGPSSGGDVAVLYGRSGSPSGTNYWEAETYLRFIDAPTPGSYARFFGNRIESPLWGPNCALQINTSGKVEWAVLLRSGSWQVVESDLGTPPTAWTRAILQIDKSGTHPKYYVIFGSTRYGPYEDSSSGTITWPVSPMPGWHYYPTSGVTSSVCFDDIVERDALTTLGASRVPFFTRRRRW